MNHIVFHPERMDFRSLRRIEVTVNHRFRNRFIVQLVGFDYCESAEGARSRMIGRETVMIIVRCDAINAFSVREHIVINLRRVIEISGDHTAEIADFHCVHAFVSVIIFACFSRPYGMIIGNEESFFARVFDCPVDAFGRIAAEKRGFIFIKFYLIFIFFRVAVQIAFVPVGLLTLFGRKCDKADVTSFRNGTVLIKIEVHFKARQSEEIFIGQIMMRNHNVVVGICDDGITAFCIFFFELFRCPTSIGNGGVTVQIGFIEIAIFGKKIFFHNHTPLIKK